MSTLFWDFVFPLAGSVIVVALAVIGSAIAYSVVRLAGADELFEELDNEEQ